MESDSTDSELEMEGESSSAPFQESESILTGRSALTPSPLCTSSDSDSEVERQVEEGRKRRLADDARPKRKAIGVKKIKSEDSGTAAPVSRSKKSIEEEDSDDSDDKSEDESPQPKKSRLRGKVTSPPSEEDEVQERQKKEPKKRKARAPLRKKNSEEDISLQYKFSQKLQNSSPGVIKSIQLKNFMCHSNFVHHFHPNLNFITGQNGSGKSALLSGILVALGGKASVTSRTNSLKTLIQKGKNTFRVAVTLYNRNGPKRYGDELTVERWVNQSGSGGYRIRCVGGDLDEDEMHWRPVKKHELDNILLTLNIQIDNPVAILNQEVARSFLRTKDPKTKFNLFYDGTLLSKLEGILDDTSKDLDATSDYLKQHKQAIQSVKKECDELTSKVEKIDELNKMKKKFERIHGEYLWSLVVEAENVREKHEEEVDRNARDVEVISRKEEELQESLNNLNEDSILRDQAEVKRNLNEKKIVFNGLKEELMAKKKIFAESKQKARSASMAVTNKEAAIEKLSGQIQKLKAEAEARAQNEADEDEERLKELQDQKKQLESVSTSLKEDADNFQQASEGARERMQEVLNEERAFASQIEMRKRNIQNLGTKANKYAAFGQRMEQLMSKVQANLRRFRQPPRGPLGACFRVKDPAFVVLVEGILKAKLESFVVDNGRDLNLMRELIASVYPNGSRKPEIIMSPFADQLFDISRNHASIPSAKTVYEMIEVENNDHIVMNALIDTCEIERMLLFKTNEDACHILKEESRCPPSLKHGFSLQFYRFIPAPKFAARVMKKLNAAQILKSGRNQEAVKRELNAEIENLKTEIARLGPLKKEIQTEMHQHQKLFDQKMAEYQRVRKQLGETVNDIKRHMSKIKQRQQRFDFNSYNEELDELKEELARQQTDREKYTKEMEEVKPRLVELDNLRQELLRDIEQLNTNLSGFAEAREQLKSRRTDVENMIKKIQAKLQHLRNIRNGLNENLRSSSAEVEEKLQHALKATGKRIETNRTPDTVRKEFKTLKVHIKEIESHLGDQDALKERLKVKTRRYKEMMQEHVPIKKMFTLLTNLNIEQKESFQRMKKHMGRTLSLFFSVMAKQRGYEGRLIVEFQERELYYFVCPDGDSMSKTIQALDKQTKPPGQSQTQENLKSQQIKQNRMIKKSLVEYSLGLSGGERSFSTICFILALWQVMECPFYMLDEFDVFMDAFNRKTSQQALICHAKKFSMNQYVLFTPLDIDSLPSSEDACVLRLFPPRRGQNGPTSMIGTGNVVELEQASSSSQGGRRPGKSNRNSDDCVENVNPASSSQRQKRGGKQRKVTNHED